MNHSRDFPMSQTMPGVEFVKRPDEGKMKGIAFIKDTHGYWIEIPRARSPAGRTAQFGRPVQ